MTPKAELDAIRSKIDMVTYLEKRGTTFRATGVDFVGLCPIHGENTPSFHVKSLTNTFYCFGCQAKGDIFNLIMALDGYSFPGAVQEAAEIAGIELTEVEHDEAYKQRQRLYKATALAAAHFRKAFLALPASHPAKQNLAERKLLNPDNAEGYGGLTDDMIGFAATGELLPVLRAEKFTEAELVEAGLFKRNESTGELRDVFRNRLVWTVYDVQRKPIGFSGRKVMPEDLDNPKSPKYLNTPQTPIYSKSNALLNLSEARDGIIKQQQVVVVEGNADVMAVKAIGTYNVVATCGTAFAEGHVEVLNRMAAAGKGSNRFEFIFCFDGDKAGIKAAKTVFEKSKSIQSNSYVVRLEDKDPTDLRLHQGEKALKEALATRVSLVEFILAEELKDWDITVLEKRMGFFGAARDILGQVDSELQKQAYVRQLAFWTGTPLVEAQKYLAGGRRQQQEQQTERAVGSLSSVQERMLAAALQFPQEYAQLATQYSIEPDFYLNYQPLAQKVLTAEPDLSDAEIARLLHSELNISALRKQEALRALALSFLKMMYNLESANLNASLAAVNLQGDAEQSLFATLQRQQELKRKYSQRR